MLEMSVRASQKHPAHLASPLHTVLSLQGGGSRKFDVLALPRTSAKAPCTPCFSSNYVAKGGSEQSNHPEPRLKNSTHFAISAMMLFETRTFSALELPL